MPGAIDLLLVVTFQNYELKKCVASETKEQKKW